VIGLMLLACAGRPAPAAVPRSVPTADVALPGATLRWYELRGAEEVALLEDCLRACPRDEAGRPVSALTSWTLRWTHQSGSGETCAVSNPDVEALVTVALPRWDGVGATPALRAQWDAWLAALLAHEAGHVRVAEAWVGVARTRLREAGCADADAVMEQANEDMRAAQAAYDAETHDGHAEGVCPWGNLSRGLHAQ
jgi:predicted secreted Zn-dependent protease